MDMKWLCSKAVSAWNVVRAWWVKLPKQKWLALGFAVLMLLIAANKVFGAEQTDPPSPLWIQGGNGLIIACNPRVNNDGIHVCASANTGQRGYCMEVPEGRFSPDDGDLGAYYCTGNQSGNKTYDKALLIKEMIDGPSKSLADIDAAVEAWDLAHPVEVSGG